MIGMLSRPSAQPRTRLSPTRTLAPARTPRSPARVFALVLAALPASACITPGLGPLPAPVPSIAQLAERAGDPATRTALLLVDEAAAASERGDLRTARARAEGALRVDARTPHAYYVLAWVGLAEGDPHAALRDAARARDLMRTTGEPPGAWLGRMYRVEAAALDALDEPAAASAARARARELDPRSQMPGRPPALLIESQSQSENGR